MSHTRRYCNNGGASIVLGRDALECSASVCSAVWEELSSRQIMCVYLDPDLRMCFALVLLFLGGEETRKDGGQHEGRKGNIDFIKATTL